MSIYGYKRRFHSYECKIKNTCGAIFDENLFKLALEYLGYRFCQRHISINLSSNGYPMFRHKRHEHKLHRIIGQFLYQDKNGEYLYHHVDENKLNASADNLVQTNNYDHSSHHNTGRKLSEEHKQAVSRAQKGKISPNRKSIIAFNKQDEIIGEFASIQEAANVLNIWRTAIDNNLNGRSNYCGGFKFRYKL